FGAPTLVPSELGKARSGAQFPEFGLLLLCDAQGFAIQFLGGLGMPLPQQRLAFVPIQLRREPALTSSFNDLQSIVQQARGLFDLPFDLTCPSHEGNIMGHPQPRPGGAVGGRTAAQQRYPLRQIAIFDFYPAAKDGSLRTPVRKSLLGRHRDQLFYSPI